MKDESHFTDQAAARDAVTWALPTIEQALGRPGMHASKALHLVVLDPAMLWGTCPFEEAILYEHSVGDRTTWESDHAAFARDKARLSWRHRVNSRLLLQPSPHLFLHDDRFLWGGVWLDGIVVGASGTLPSWDEACAMVVAVYMRAAALERSAQISGAAKLQDNGV